MCKNVHGRWRGSYFYATINPLHDIMIKFDLCNTTMGGGRKKPWFTRLCCSFTTVQCKTWHDKHLPEQPLAWRELNCLSDEIIYGFVMHCVQKKMVGRVYTIAIVLLLPIIILLIVYACSYILVCLFFLQNFWLCIMHRRRWTQLEFRCTCSWFFFKKKSPAFGRCNVPIKGKLCTWEVFETILLYFETVEKICKTPWVWELQMHMTCC